MYVYTASYVCNTQGEHKTVCTYVCMHVSRCTYMLTYIKCLYTVCMYVWSTYPLHGAAEEAATQHGAGGHRGVLRHAVGVVVAGDELRGVAVPRTAHYSCMK